MKILVLCNHGNVRSVALKYLIQRLYDHDVLAAGVEDLTADTLLYLAKWADRIITLTPEAMKTMEGYTDKLSNIYIGKDVWHNPFAQELQHKLLKELKNLEL